MELLYIWIEDYKNIKNQGFNFSPKYRFDYNHETKELTCEEKQGLPDDFFGKNITNVTAIIGENGSGKSSVLEAIVFNQNPKFKNFIAIMKTENNFILELNKTDLTVINQTKYKIEKNKGITNFPYSVLEKGSFSNTEYEATDLGFIFYNNFQYNNSDQFLTPRSNLLDVTTKSILKFEKLYANLNHYYEDITTKLEFISYANTNKIMFLIDECPNFVKIVVNSNYWSNSDKNIIPVTKLPRPLDYLSILQYSFLVNMKDERDYKSLLEDARILNLLQKDIIDFDLVFDLLIEMHEPIKKVVDTINSIIKLLIDLGNENLNIVENKDKLLDLINLLRKEKIGHPIGFEWFFHKKNEVGYLSSGEDTLLTMYSRIYRLKNFKKQHIILLLDEPDLGLHPDWQKKLLKNLIKILPEIFSYEEEQEGEKIKKYRKIQLILTSHSPFLVSDLPKENLIFLEKEQGTGKCKVSKLQDRKETFGANIHTLFTDSFFMQGGLIGEFAEGKINEVIDLLNQTTPLLPEKIRYCEQILNMIGEPIIKNMLRKLLDSKRLQKVEDHETRIKHLERELAKLRGGNRED